MERAGSEFSFAVMARMLIGLVICLLLLRATRAALVARLSGADADVREIAAESLQSVTV